MAVKGYWYAMKTPRNIAIIPDGNRRFARKHDLAVSLAYKKGFEKVGDVIDWAQERRIRSLSFWALSFENFQKRSSVELNILFRLMRKKIESAFDDPALVDRQVRIKFFGRTDILPRSLQERMHRLEEKTSGFSHGELNIGVAYSGQEELVSASKRLAQDIASGKIGGRKLDELSVEDFAPYLYVQSTPDLIIRTGNVQRLSGFLPFQSAYSEYYFVSKLWPEFTERDFQRAIEYYEGTQRRFGQ